MPEVHSAEVLSDPCPHASKPSGNALALLHEIAAMLEAMLAEGRSTSLDLRRAPLPPADYEALKAALGEGAVSATVQALGPSHVRETGIAGVWWVSHCNQDGRVVGELIEVTECPQLLKTPPEDARTGLARLGERLSANLRQPDEHAVRERAAALGLCRAVTDQPKKESRGDGE